MNRIMIVPVAAAIVAAAGCGGSTASRASSPQTAATAVSTAATATSSVSEDVTTAKADGDLSGTTLVGFTTSRQMRAYLRHVVVVRRRLSIAHRWTRALDAAIGAHDGDTAGAAAGNAATSVREALAIAKRISPKEPLRTVHSQLLANLRLGVAYLTRMANDLDAHDMRRIRRWPKTVVPTIRRSERWYAEWAANTAAFANGLGVRPPRWLRTMDRWN